MNSTAQLGEKNVIAVDLTPDEALALTGVEFNGNHEVKATAQRKIRSAFEKTFDIQKN
ncbi:hypothetical protein [Paenibacillus crassostreae]|uniref:hypothetical protein n=1 Tax=Paenibacillus crassostreae TaxID=1763538 RepID=UPI000ADBA74F|nr:hypothetical protein [Paenibacillus crassostreae]